MASELLPATQDIHTIFLEEVGRIGGTVTDCFDDGCRLFLRSVLPKAREVRPGDRVQGGVALMTTGEEVRVHPYTFRQVCRNGAIMARATQTRSVERVGLSASGSVVAEKEAAIRDAVQACAASEALSTAMEQMRSAAEIQADLALRLLPMLPRLAGGQSTRLLSAILDEFEEQQDDSLFGLMNAITSVARGESDPGIRWRLEELGGSIPATIAPTKPGGVAAELVQA